MSDDPLAEFRSKKSEPKRGGDPPSGKEPYTAFKVQDRVIALDLQRTSGASHTPSYAYLLDIAYGRRFYTTIRLFFTYMVVKITGENLKDVVDALVLRKCSQLHEWNPKDFPPPAAGAPVIRKIEILVKHFSESMTEAEQEEHD